MFRFHSWSFPLKYHRREDLEDLLNDPAYFQAFFHSLPQVKALFQEQMELEQANEEIASERLHSPQPWVGSLLISC